MKFTQSYKYFLFLVKNYSELGLNATLAYKNDEKTKYVKVFFAKQCLEKNVIYD